MKKLVALMFLSAFCISSLYAQDRDLRIIQKSENRTSERRFALLIGNSAYKESPLSNPVNDAKDMAEVLRATGFDVTIQQNNTKSDIKRAIRAFGEQIRNGGVGLFYFAGHAVQVDGKNYLIPVDATINHEYEVEEEAVDLDFLLGQMRNAENHLNIVILDACRNNPFVRSFRSSSRGLAYVNAPSGTIIAYSTRPGDVAMDGRGRNSPYTEELLKYIRVPGLEIQFVFRRVREAVLSKTNRQQEPWESTSLVGDFYFATNRNEQPSASVISSPAVTGRVNTAPRKETRTTKDEDNAYKAWYDANAIRDYSRAFELAKLYLEDFPNGRYSAYLRDKWSPQVLGHLFNEALRSRNTNEMIRLGNEALAADPGNLDYLYLLAVNIRVMELFANPPNYSHSAEAADYTQRAIRLIEAGKRPTGVQQWKQNEALAYLYQTLAIIEEKNNNLDHALEYHLKASTLEPSNAAHFLACGRIHQDKYLKAVQKYQAFPEAEKIVPDPSQEVKAALEDVNKSADAVIDCWARFLGMTATRNDFGPVRGQVEKAFIDLYKYRHPYSPDSFQQLINRYKNQ